jgi:AraC family transcriptional regulator
MSVNDRVSIPAHFDGERILLDEPVAGIAPVRLSKVKRNLAKLKDTKPMAQFEPTRFEDGGPLLIAGLNEHYTPETMNRIPEQWQRFGPFIGNVPGQIDQKTYGVCYNVSGGEFDYLTGVTVSDTSGLPGEFVHIQIPAQRYAVFFHREHISKIQNTIEAIGKQWLPTAGYEPTGTPTFFERYENFNLQTGMGDIEIWLPIKVDRDSPADCTA